MAVALTSSCQDSVAPEIGCPYTVNELEHWFQTGNDVLSVPGTTMFDNDEVRGCLVVGISDSSARPGVEAKLRELSIPLNAVVILIFGPISVG